MAKLAKLGVSKLPGRKRPVLFVLEGTVLRPLAYFVSDEAMERYQEFNVQHTPQEPKP